MNNIFFITRLGEGHLINYKRFDGKYVTACSKVFDPNDHLNILASDSNCPILCKACSDYINLIYNSMLNKNIRYAYNNQESMFMNSKYRGMSVDEKYDLFLYRYWHKLASARSKLIR
jgi:hypothetical protein